MDDFSFMVLFVSVITFLAVWASVSRSAEREQDGDRKPSTPRYTAYFVNHNILIILVVFLPVLLLVREMDVKVSVMVMLLGLFIHISLFYLILALLLPHLRRFFNARTCAALWLLPNFLYLVMDDFVGIRRPLFTLCVPEVLLGGLFGVWITGLLAVLIWKSAEHLRFREHILGEGWIIEDPDILALWGEELKRAGYREEWFDLVCSPVVHTPLTIGFFESTIRVVLPQRDYTPEELRLIFRHEIVHIGRKDAGTKLMFTCCIAVCWFNPLMWWAMRKSADDLELSCDETVLLDAEEGERRRYADLLLRTAGDERGFTTCLSVSAKALQYRLHRVMRPQKRWTGGVMAGLVAVALLLSCGSVALSYDRGTGAELIFQSYPAQQFELTGEADWTAPDGTYALEVVRPGEMKDYLSGLKAEKINESYAIFYAPTSEYRLRLELLGPDGTIRLALREHVMTVSAPGSYETYYLPGRLDWTYLETLLETHA